MSEERTRILLGDRLDILKSKRVAVFGLGGVGSFAAESLVRCGIRNIILVDYAQVSESNLNRQIIATRETVGKKKTEVMKERILSINPKADVECFDVFLNKESIDKILEETFDGAVDAIDVVTSKVYLMESLRRKGIKFISSLGMGGRWDPTKIEVTTLDKTSYDSLAKALRKKLREDKESLKIPVVYSTEQVESFTGRNVEGSTRKEKYPIGSTPFVPSAAGLTAASWLVRELTK